MSDIQLRFNKDMLVLSAPVEAEFLRLGVDVDKDWAYTLMFEPEVVEEAYKVESMAGAQCLVADTARLTPLGVLKTGLDNADATIADNALNAVSALKPQHILVEIGPCGLPLDAASKASLMENRDQYTRAARLFEGKEFDAFFLNGFVRCADLKCALMGIRKVSDKPIFASVDVDDQGNLARKIRGSGRSVPSAEASPVSSSASSTDAPWLESIEDAACVMEEFGADVCGFATFAAPDQAASMLVRMHSCTPLPSLVQLCVGTRNPDQESPTDDNPYFDPDTMLAAADILRAAGVQFLRAAGDATPAYTGALVAATDRADVGGSEDEAILAEELQDIDDLADDLRARVASALGKSGA